MKKFTSSILVGLACTSILSLSIGVHPIKASAQTGNNTLCTSGKVELKDVIYEKNLDQYSDWVYEGFKADNTVNGYITDKTSILDFQIRYVLLPRHHFLLKDSSDNIVQYLPEALKGKIALENPLKPGETYKIVPDRGSGTHGILLSFKVVSGETIRVPTINKVTNLDKNINGTGVPGATVHLNIAGDNYSGAVDNQGNYKISLNRAYPTGSSITLYQEKDGVKSDSIQSKVVESDHLEVPKLNKVTINDQQVTGTGVPGATVYLTINGAHFHSTVSDNGTFSINIEKKYPANTPIEAYQEYNGIKSKTTTIYVESAADLVVQKIKTDSTNITGSDLPNTSISVRIDDMDFSGETDSNGQFSIDLQGYTFKAGTDVIITSQRSGAPITKTIQIYPKDPIVGLVFAGDNEVRGTADPGSIVTITVGTTKYQSQVNNSGSFRQSVNPNLIVSGTVITVYSTSNGLDSEKITTAVN